MLFALLSTAVVVGASIAMELTASTLGQRHHVAEIVIGALVLAGVTSLPNAVSALYLAVRGRGAATLSIALNSNALNVTVGLLLPGLLVGLGAAVRAGNPGRRLVSRPDRRDAGMRVYRPRPAPNSRRADHLRLFRVRRRGPQSLADAAGGMVPYRS